MQRRSRIAGSVLLALAAGIGGASTACAEESYVYKWVDAAGITHFSDQPPANATAQEMTLRYRRTDRGTVQAGGQPGPAGSSDDASARRAEQAQSEADREQVLAERRKTCEQARDRVAKYSTAQRLYRPGPNGERIYLTDKELDAERADANRAVEEWCDDG